MGWQQYKHNSKKNHVGSTHFKGRKVPFDSMRGAVQAKSTRRGVGIMDLRVFNIILILKWWQKILRHPKGQLQRVLFEKYDPRTRTWREKSRNSSITMPFWKGLQIVKWIFWFKVVFMVGKGDWVTFWKDRWCSSSLFRTLFPKVFTLAFDKECTVNNFIVGGE